jgi:hypothetical protein
LESKTPSGILDGEDDDTEVDLASMAYQIWKNATDENPELNKIIPDLPNVIYATKHNDEAPEKEGVIVYTRTTEENDILAWVDNSFNTMYISKLYFYSCYEYYCLLTINNS